MHNNNNFKSIFNIDIIQIRKIHVVRIYGELVEPWILFPMTQKSIQSELKSESHNCFTEVLCSKTDCTNPRAATARATGEATSSSTGRPKNKPF